MDNQPDNGQRLPGSTDPTFGTNGVVHPGEGSGVTHTIISDEDGRLTHASTIGNKFLHARLLVNGQVDKTFEPLTSQFDSGDKSTPFRLLMQKDGKTVLIGESQKDNVIRPGVKRFNTTGSPDLVFDKRILEVPENSTVPNYHYKFVDGCLQDDQKILIVAAYLIQTTGAIVCRLYRLKDDGSPDTGFGKGQSQSQSQGFIDIKFNEMESFAQRVHVQSDGKIIVTGIYFDAQRKRTGAIARYDQQGELDKSFGTNGFSEIKLGDTDSYAASDSTDSDFTASDALSCLQSDDKVIFATWIRGADGRDHGLLTRRNADGSPDDQFNTGLPVITSREDGDVHWREAGVQADGKIVLVGYVRWATPGREIFMAKQRFSQEGKPEEFNWSQTPGDYGAIAFQSDKRIVVSGSSGGTSKGNPVITGLLAK